MDTLIESVLGREILDSRGNPTVEVEVILLDGSLGRAAVPSGASTGVHEALELRDGDLQRYLGKGVTKAVDNVNNAISEELSGWDATEQKLIDTIFIVLPLGAPSFTEGLRWIAEIYHNLKSVLKERGYTALVGDEGGYAPALKANNEAVEVILTAIEKAGYKAGAQVGIALDPAASELFDEDTRLYNLRKEGKQLTGEQMVAFWKSWGDQYPIVSIEDGLAQDDWESWVLVTPAVGGRIQIVGDDLLVTNPQRVIRALIDN